jgi:hypothetical protein
MYNKTVKLPLSVELITEAAVMSDIPPTDFKVTLESPLSWVI